MAYEELYAELINCIKLYHPAAEFPLVEKSFIVAKEAHKDQYRKSGESYIIHPLSVAIILAQLQLDLESIAAGLLHDVIEDTKYTYADISAMFGEDVAQLVDGVTKLDMPTYIAKSEQQAENFRKMFIAMAKDIRVILIKISDRLHNMRTLKFQPEAKQKEIAQETLDIYAPLSHRLGISKLRYELEDICFKYLEPKEYKDLSEKINRKLSERRKFVQTMVDEIRVKLDARGVNVNIEGRPKHFFSIYKKMVGQNKTLDQLYDLIAVRVIVNTVSDCYTVLGILHENYKPVPNRFKDYIGMPKQNKYQSLHTTLLSTGGEPFEVQIRTYEMHRTAEYGIAAHWRYKEGRTEAGDPHGEEAKLTWLREILEWQRTLSTSTEFLDALKTDLNVFREHVYCFTPKGEVVSLLNGATTIDFAYAIHSAIGNRMKGAKVNGKIVPIETTLNNGDRVEIITSQNIKGPSLGWLKFVKTSTARGKINQWFKKENRDENIIKGKELLTTAATAKRAVLDELLTPERKQMILEKFNYPDWDTLCAAVGHGGLKETSVVNRLIEDAHKDDKYEVTISSDDIVAKDRKKRSGIVVKGIGDINVRFPKCCNPLPGDEIVGFVTRGRGLSIHRTDCKNIISLDNSERSRLLNASWQMPERSASIHFRADLRVLGQDRVGLFNDVSRVIMDERISVKELGAKTHHNSAIFNISLEITSREQLDHLIIKLRGINGVYEVERT
ncbi:MAG: bifunctional (p)ppGpp synthetase/guanosine-3',5'-bis(diphosphate) 3'-pyrophosphohydrolase [Clostridiales bacterium]|jgi:GTP pyrophosphokinase|nr:bifunctional (p)ppGpp synthetase/guanosine-3',5'-bis(diphosphate) 3'-pyrophosphohydrolase [Clostridiales bacterium]